MLSKHYGTFVAIALGTCLSGCPEAVDPPSSSDLNTADVTSDAASTDTAGGVDTAVDDTSNGGDTTPDINDVLLDVVDPDIGTDAPVIGDAADTNVDAGSDEAEDSSPPSDEGATDTGLDVDMVDADQDVGSDVAPDVQEDVEPDVPPVSACSSAPTGTAVGQVPPDYPLVTCDGEDVTLRELVCDAPATWFFSYAHW